MKAKRIISTLLSVLMLLGAFSFATMAEETAEETVEYTYNTSNTRPTIDYFTGQSIKESGGTDGETKYVASGEKIIYTAEDKLATMDLRYEKDGYRLYVDAYSGEVATYCVATGEILFSNPYTVGNSTATGDAKNVGIKGQLMSQLVVKYVDIASGDDNTYYSYEWAAMRGQIVVRNIKNGIRVEYTIGREEARMLVPRQVEKSSFEKKILNVMEAAVQGDSHGTFLYKKVMAYYTLQDPDAAQSETLKQEMQKSFPITKKMAVYILDSSTSQTEMANIEQLIKTYCPDYTYEDLDDDHMLTEYESEDKNPPLFKMALEYSLDENGMTVRLPANGIRFNEALYQLYSIEILPYMGAGANPNSGYTFFPDGSGTLFDFEKIEDLGASTTVTGKVYGQDYAYHTISGTHQEILRYPVFGIVEKENLTALEQLREEDEKKKQEAAAGADGEASTETTEPVEPTEPVETVYKDRGFVAIVEEGDALMELSSYHAVRTSEYNTVRMIVYPRPQDTYNVADAISVGQNDTWTVVSSRKYTGNYKVRYIMLTDDEVAAEKGIEVGDYYDCTYVGMAKAYREYLESEEILTRISNDDVTEDIPLYIETFGALETTERFLSIPLDVMTPLTTFDNIATMYEELSEKGVENINFIMTGYTKGGLTTPQVPYHLKWDGAVKDDMDFEDLLAYAEREGFGVYPDFDFVYVQGGGMFDGLSLKKHAVKTIDNRYTSKREYSATKQTYVSYYELALSPAYYSHFYEKLADNYLEYEPMGISVSTLGSALNSDFDEDEPYNREDSKNFTVRAFEYLDEKFDKVMTSGGNAYSWKYVDYITDIALDSSRYAQSAAAVPFLGIVLHGYVELAGTPVNMEGNIDYAVLKAIENGASLKFILSYQNTNNLKNYETLSQYYSVRYDIWFDDVVELYNEVNEALSGVQTSLITHHEFVEGVRVPDDDELANDAAKAIEAAIANENALQKAKTEAEKDAYREARQGIVDIYNELNKQLSATETGYARLKKQVEDAKAAYDKAIDYTPLNEGEIAGLKQLIEIATNKKTELDNSTATDKSELQQAYDKAVTDVVAAYNSAYTAFVTYSSAMTALLDESVRLIDMYELMTGEYSDTLEKDTALTDAQRNDLNKMIAEIELLVNGDANADPAVAADARYAILQKTASVLATEMITEVNTAREDIVSNIEDAKDYLAETDIPPVEYTYELPKPEEAPAPEVDMEITTPVYSSDDNKIVYEVYENGTAFILNFNNYKVMVEVEGTVYTLDAYGYIILKNED